MKALSITGFTIAIISFIGAMYLKFTLIPIVEHLDNIEHPTDLERSLWAGAYSSTGDFAVLILFGSILCLLLCSIPAIKIKNKFAWAGVILSLVSLIIGLAYGTHLFS